MGHRNATLNKHEIHEYFILTGGGLILQMPVFSATSLIFSIYAIGSLNSSHVGSNTGASGGGTNSPWPQQMSSILRQPPFSPARTRISEDKRHRIQQLYHSIKSTYAILLCQNGSKQRKVITYDKISFRKVYGKMPDTSRFFLFFRPFAVFIILIH